MKRTEGRQALFYPFHLCHPTTLEQLLAQFEQVHFRDYMALQLTPFTGTTAYEDRMGDTYPDLVKAGRLVQGYHVSGPLHADVTLLIDRDLTDETWRRLFHDSFVEDRRFQRGLFDPSHGMVIGRTLVPGAAALLRLMDRINASHPYSVERVQQLSQHPNSLEEGYECEYGLALLKTSASLVYTIRLAQLHNLQAVTDSPPHHDLLLRTMIREQIHVPNVLLPRSGY